MKRVKRILAAVTAAAMTLLIAPELGGEVFSQVGELMQDFAVSVSAEEGEAAPVEAEPVPIGSESVQSEVDTGSNVTDDLTANDGIAVQSNVTVIDSGYCGNRSENDGKNVTWTLDDKGVLTIDGYGEVIVNGYHSTWVKDKVASVIINNGITSIGYNSFGNCKNLIEVKLPKSIVSISGSAFWQCTSLTSITIPDSVTSIGDSAFDSCTSLTNITIPNSVTSIGGGAFFGCTSLTSITIPDSVTTIDQNAFASCTSLTSITIPDSVTSIGGYAFVRCTNLTNITIPDSVTSIGGSAFKSCTSLTRITIIPGSVTTIIGQNAFEGCTSLTSITIPDSVTTIDQHTFSGCTNLTNINIPKSVTDIKFRAFYQCTGLENVTIPCSLGEYAFDSCVNLKDVIFSNEKYISVNRYSFKDCINLNNIIFSEKGTYYLSAISGFNKDMAPNIVFYGKKRTEAERYAKNNNIPFRELIDWTNDSEAHIFEGTLEYVGKGHYGTGYDPNEPATYNYYALKLNEKVYVLSHYPINKDTNVLEVDTIYLSSRDITNNDLSKFVNKEVRITGTIFECPDGCAEYVGASEIMFHEISDIVSLEPDVPTNPDNPDKPIDPDNPDDPEDPNEPVDEETAKDYDFSVSVHLANSKDEIVYNVDEKTYNKNEYELGAYFDSSKGGKSINGLKVLYSISGGFAFSADGAKTEISSEIKSSFLTDTWEFASEPFKVYPISNVDISEQGYFSVRVSVYAGDKLIKKVREDVPIKVKKTPDDAPDNINGIKITSENIDDFLDQNGDLIITDGEYAISGKVSCNNLYVKGGQLRVGGILDVKGNAEITGGKTNWFNPISQDVCGGVLTVYGTLNVKGNMTVGTDSGILEMTNSKAVVDVAGDFKITANSTMYRSKLTAGVLKIGGSFESSGKDSGNFKASGDHITHFYSNDSFSVKMNTKDKDDDKNSYFNNLTFTDSAVNNYSGELYTFNVKGYFRQNDTQNPNYVKGELLDRLFKDHTTFGEAEEAVIGRFVSLSGSTSLLKTSINAGTNKKIPKEYIDMICAYSEMYFQMEVMNNENDKNFSIEGAEIKIHGFEKEITFYNIPFGDSTAEVTIHFNVMGGGYSSSTADLCEAKWLVFYDNDSGYLSGMAPMTYISTDSLASDLRKFAQEEGHFGDFWYWMTEFVNGFISDYGSFTKADVRGVKCQMAFLDKCYKSLKSHSISPFKYNIKSGSDALKKAKKFADVVNKGNTWISAFLCPVDVEIRDSENNVVGSIVDNKVIVSTNKVTMKAIGDKKYCTFNEHDNYFITLTATGTGTMDYIIDELNDISTYRRISFNDIPLNLGTVYTGNFECINMLPDENYKLTDNLGNVYTSDFDEVDLNGNIKSLITEADQPSQPTPSIPSVPSNPSTDNSGNQGGSTINSTAPASTSFNVKLENKITGKTGKAKATRTDKNITINVGRENNGYYANIYNTNGNLIDSVKIKNGKAKFTISSDIDFYIVIDQDSHLEYEDVSSGAGIYELFEEKKEPFCMIIIVITALGFLSVAIAKRYQKNKR